MTLDAIPETAILLVDDEPAVRDTLLRGLQQMGFSSTAAVAGERAIAELQAQRFSLMLCDIRLRGMDGIELLKQAIALDPDMPVVMVTALAGIEPAIAAMRAGAYDYVTKPFTLAEIEVVVRRAIEYRTLRLQNRRYVTELEALVKHREGQVRQIAINVIASLGLALEAKDEWTHDHSRRVADLAARLSQQLGMDAAFVSDIRLAGLLHDIGKIGVRESVLHKPNELTPEEYAHIKLHPDLGARILAPLQELGHIIPFIRHHHERWDGAGYPGRLAGEAIPYGARILAVADAYVAMREHRPYRQGMSIEGAMREIQIGARRQFDIRVVGALLRLHVKNVLNDLDAVFPQEALPTLNVA